VSMRGTVIGYAVMYVRRCPASRRSCAPGTAGCERLARGIFHRDRRLSPGRVVKARQPRNDRSLRQRREVARRAQALIEQLHDNRQTDAQ